MGLIRTATVGIAAANAAGIAANATPAAGAAFTLTASPVVLDQARRVIITSAGNDSTRTFTITGTNRSGNIISETITGGNIAAVSTVNDFKTVSAVVNNGPGAVAATGATVGTSGVASTQWFNIDGNADPISISVDVIVSGTINYSVEYTYDDPNVVTAPTVWTIAGGSLTSKTANADSQANPFNFPIWGLRLTQNSATPPASATITVQQAGPYH
jgi:hypothetical protein